MQAEAAEQLSPVMHKVLICGSRDYTNRAKIARLVELLAKTHGVRRLLIIHGGANGADIIADQAAKDLGVHRARVDALWDAYRKAAGPIRNGAMLALEPHEAYAFHPNIEDSRGTKNMVEQLRKAGVRVRVLK